ncbi:MAG: S16 family serine protease, partial [Sulfolobales archaeon]|nr:hypothetical protein [Sulfolobales archaeon]MDW8010875.1 S16 family serine protease [Sulfolobales archaeon]
AAIVASRVSGTRFASCDFLASIKAGSPIVGGPSASAATAAAFAAALLDLPLRSDVVLTGMVMPDGSVAPVGGLRLKLEAAAKAGARVFLVPYGQTKYTETVTVPRTVGPVTIYTTETVVVDLVSYGRELGVEVVPVATVHEALKILTSGRYVPPEPAERTATIYNITVLERRVRSWSEALRARVLEAVESGDSIKESAMSSLPRPLRASLESIVKDIESEVHRLLNRADGLYEQRYLYSAASTYFQVLINSLWRLYLLKGLESTETLNAIGRGIESRVKDVVRLVHDRFAASGTLCLQSLDVAIATLSRAYEALLYLNKSTSESRIDRLTYYLAVAESRAITAELWSLLLLEDSESGACCTLDPKYLEYSTVVVENLVYNIYAYVISFQERIRVPTATYSEMVTRVELMERSAIPLDRLSLGVDALAYGYATLVSMFTQDVNSTIAALGRAIGMELGLEPLRDCTPISLVLYLELAATQNESAISKIYTLTRVSALASFYADSLRERSEYEAPRAGGQVSSDEEKRGGDVVSERTVTAYRTITQSSTLVEPVLYLGIGTLIGLLLTAIITTARTPKKTRTATNSHTNPQHPTEQ